MRKLSRRAFLRGGGTALVAAPLAPGLVARLARWFDSKRFWSRAEAEPSIEEFRADLENAVGKLLEPVPNRPHPGESFNCRCVAEPIGTYLNDAEAGEPVWVSLNCGAWTERKV